MAVDLTGFSVYLRLSEHERRGHFESFGSREVLVLSKLVLQFQQLLTGEGRAGASRLAQ